MRQNALGTMGDEVMAILVSPPKPKRERYPSEIKTPAVATRVPLQAHDELVHIAKELQCPLSLVLKMILLDWLERNKADGLKAAQRLVTNSPTRRCDL